MTQPMPRSPNVILTIILSSRWIWRWDWIYLKVDFKIFPTSTYGPQSISGVKSYARWNFLLRERSETGRTTPFPPQFLLCGWSKRDQLHLILLRYYCAESLKRNSFVCSANDVMVESSPCDPLPFLSSPSFLSRTKVRVFLLSKYNGQELKNELTWWLSWRAQARVIGPSGGNVSSAGVGAGVIL